MNPPLLDPDPPIIYPAPRRPWVSIILMSVVALACLVLVVGVTGCFRSSGDARALGASVARASGGQWEKRVELRAGGVLLGLARLGLSFADLEPEAKTALSAIRGVEFGLYQSKAGNGSASGATLLRSADQAMSGRGWDRVVTVVNSDQLVAVYASNHEWSSSSLRVCLVVLNEHQMVVAGGRANTRPLLALARLASQH